MCAATVSVSRTRPSSTSIITAVVVATTFVSEARSKTVSSVIGFDGRLDRAVAERLLVDDLVAAADHDDGAGHLLRGDGVVDDVGDARHAPGVEGGGRADGLRAAVRGAQAGDHDGGKGESDECAVLHWASSGCGSL